VGSFEIKNSMPRKRTVYSERVELIEKARRVPTDFTKTEHEVVVLKAIWELIGEMVNYEMFVKPESTTVVTSVMFSTRVHQRLFNIFLVDFLSQPKRWPFGLTAPAAGAAKSDMCILFHLKRICEDPQFNPAGGDALRVPLVAFTQWLEAECCVEKVWLPSINVETDIRVKRIMFIKICGNIAKHNFTRLSMSVGDICEVLKSNGTNINIDEGYLVIPEFYEWFHHHVLGYHSSAIAEFLNNIRWGIFDYLKPEFDRSFTKDDPTSIAYRFIYPSDCNNPVIRNIYWDLMNAVRSEPYVPRFEVTGYLKMRF
jgi:hypothetical protein